MSKPERSELASESAGAAIGGLVGVAMGMTGASPAVTALLGGAAGPYTAAWFRMIAGELTKRGPVVSDAAAASSGMKSEELLERVSSDAELQPLAQRIMEAIAHTGDDQKLQALGRVLGEAVGQRPRSLDESIMIVQTIDALQPVHVRVMEALQRDPRRNADGTARVWTVSVLGEELTDMNPIATEAAVAGLVSLGLAYSGDESGITFGTYYRLTNFGRAMLQVVGSRGSEA